MRRRNTGCGCTVVSYGHRRNNIAIQQTVTLVIAYRDAAETIPTQPSAPKIPAGHPRAWPQRTLPNPPRQSRQKAWLDPRRPKRGPLPRKNRIRPTRNLRPRKLPQETPPRQSPHPTQNPTATPSPPRPRPTQIPWRWFLSPHLAGCHTFALRVSRLAQGNFLAASGVQFTRSSDPEKNQ